MFFKLLKMNNYLKHAKNASKKISNALAVMGNESTDLDSAVSSISLAYHLNTFGINSRIVPNDKRRKSYQIIPIINCKRIDLPLKTEVTYWIKEHGIEIENLVCTDEIDTESNVENFILVDHHVSPFHEKVFSVLDHRPYDEKSMLDDECIVNIQEVGSCATLVMDAIKTDVGTDALKKERDLLHFLYGPIVLDTINFSKDADKTRELDIEMTEFIERTLSIENVAETRLDIFKTLVNARADVSSLDSLQILSKDLKIVSNKTSTIKVAMAGVHVFEYPTMDNATDNIKKFAERENVDIVMLMGMKPSQNTVERQLAVVNIKNKTLYDDIIKTVNSMDPALELSFCDDIKFLESQFFHQRNAKISRKQILPVVRELLQSY